MARTLIPITALSALDFINKPTPTEIDTSNQMAIAAGGWGEGLVLQLDYSLSGSAATAVAIKAGNNPPAFRSGLGDLTLSAAGSAVGVSKLFALEDTARFVQSDGSIHIDFDAVVSGSAMAFRAPK